MPSQAPFHLRPCSLYKARTGLFSTSPHETQEPVRGSVAGIGVRLHGEAGAGQVCARLPVRAHAIPNPPYATAYSVKNPSGTIYIERFDSPAGRERDGVAELHPAITTLPECKTSVKRKHEGLPSNQLQGAFSGGLSIASTAPPLTRFRRSRRAGKRRSVRRWGMTNPDGFALAFSLQAFTFVILGYPILRRQGFHPSE